MLHAEADAGSDSEIADVTDGASEFRALYLEHCAACERAGIPAPTPEEWVERMDEMIIDRSGEES